jgi:hypothetical protein
MDWLSLKAAQERDARRQASPDRFESIEKMALRRPARRAARLAKATSLHFASQHDRQTFRMP